MHNAKSQREQRTQRKHLGLGARYRRLSRGGLRDVCGSAGGGGRVWWGDVEFYCPDGPGQCRVGDCVRFVLLKEMNDEPRGCQVGDDHQPENDLVGYFPVFVAQSLLGQEGAGPAADQLHEVKG